MKRIALAVILFVLSGCAIQPPLGEQHPAGTSKLVQISPECARPRGRVEAACRNGAQMLEATTPEKATAIFLTYWEDDVLDYLDELAKAGRARGDFADNITAEMIYGKMQRQARNAVKRVSVPVLETVYREKPGEYSKRMAEQLELIDAGSRSSFDTFREVHANTSTRN